MSAHLTSGFIRRTIFFFVDQKTKMPGKHGRPAANNSRPVKHRKVHLRVKEKWHTATCTEEWSGVPLLHALVEEKEESGQVIVEYAY